MTRHLRAHLRTLAMVSVVRALLFGNLTDAQADTPDEPAAEPTMTPGETLTLMPMKGECGVAEDCGDVDLT